MSQVACDIYFYCGRWRPRSHHSRFDLVCESLGCAFDGRGEVRKVALGEIEDSPDGRRRVVHVLADWWGDDDEEVCGSIIHATLVDHLEPEFDSQVEVDVAIMSVGLGDDCHDYWDEDWEIDDAC